MAAFEERYVSDFAVIGGTIIGPDATGRVGGRPARRFEGKDYPWPAGSIGGPATAGSTSHDSLPPAMPPFPPIGPEADQTRSSGRQVDEDHFQRVHDRRWR
jgi:hypothetical protein